MSKVTATTGPEPASEPMSLTEAAYHLLFWLDELEDNHPTTFNKIMKAFADDSVDKEKLLFSRATAALLNFRTRYEGVIEVDPDTAREFGLHLEIRLKPQKEDG